MIDKIKRCFRTVWEFFKHQLKDRITRWTFIIVYLVMTSEVWLCYILGIIFKNGVLIGVATTSLAFWCAPATPLIPLCLGITTGIRLLIKKIFKR
jgi:hypothetical protein